MFNFTTQNPSIYSSLPAFKTAGEKTIPMHIHFNYHGSSYEAGLAKQPEGKIIVLLNNSDLEKQFGSSLPFYIKNKSVNFNTLNWAHSELYALNSTISKAITEQCQDIL